MSLQKSSAAFKASLSSAASQLPARPKINPPPPPQSAPPTTSTNATAVKRKRPAAPPAPVVYSQPSDTSLQLQHILTQVHHAVQYLKEKERPMTPREITGYLSIDETPQLLHYLRGHPKLKWDEQNQAFEFVPIHNIRSATALLAFLQNQPTAAGISIKELKEGWSGALDAVDKLEAEREILVTRTKKDNQARMVWGNDKSLDVQVEDEFKDLWHAVKVPPYEELPGMLEVLGLKPTSLDPAKMKKEVKKVERKKRANNRRVKVSNTHMSGVLMDSKALRSGLQ
ncbi:transcription initiation factor IIE, beta subunit [Ascodesmis nigricans]|uniref:Transcription initiation factor IIE subunit beta n=1 Tax=Ascodesmis nigricans TaxID=341454 RepID=A0A4S2N746_9PEZI|nr:transcription initiation factor IIE, beta subunit [Ascodesmis nigricans]